MSLIQFPKHKNFQIENSHWGAALVENIIALLENIVDTFYNNLNLDLISKRDIYIYNSKNHNPPLNHPIIYRSAISSIIYLSVSDRFWAKFSYQFSHELCHHIIDSDFIHNKDEFGWIEETLCELASIYCLDKMSQTWRYNPPYFNWSSYADSLNSYLTEIVGREENKIKMPFKVWLSANIKRLYEDRYLRTENTVIATHLFPYFKSNPQLWQTIQYIKEIDVTNTLDLNSFFDCWIELVPKELKDLLNGVRFFMIG